MFGIGLALASGSLALPGAPEGTPPTWVEPAALVTANLITTVVRFLARLIPSPPPHLRFAPPGPPCLIPHRPHSAAHPIAVTA